MIVKVIRQIAISPYSCRQVGDEVEGLYSQGYNLAFSPNKIHPDLAIPKALLHHDKQSTRNSGTAQPSDVLES